MRKSFEVEVQIRNGQCVIVVPADVPDGGAKLSVTLVTKGQEAAAAAAPTQPDAGQIQLMRQWQRMGLSKNEMVRKLGVDPDTGWRWVNELSANS
ncbi:MAG TPA: hypothetical protein VGE07_11140 [Herpetosiphonaceae bacterium]